MEGKFADCDRWGETHRGEVEGARVDGLLLVGHQGRLPALIALLFEGRPVDYRDTEYRICYG